METNCTILIVPGLVDSPLKLHLLLLFYRHPRLSCAAGNLSEWLRECPWEIEEAAEALADAGFLARAEQHGRIQYRLEPSREWWTLLECLATCYDDPLRRDDIYARVRAADRERQFRDCVAADEAWQVQVGW
ncbi:MAG TPA: hypothetical protein VGJ87_14145 [Roseiflexaceae bacterium]|jgi:hypothetical protein